MDSRRASETRLTPDAAEFVRFCYRRRAVGWPELYDEMCAVASRGLFRGWGPSELGDNGVGFGLFELPALAGLVARIVAEEQAARHTVASTRATIRVVADPSATSADTSPPAGPEWSHQEVSAEAPATAGRPHLVSLAS